MLAALMVSMMVLTTALLAHGLATHDRRPGVRPVSVAERGPSADERQLLVRVTP